MIWALACAADPAPEPPVVCADLAARDERPFDRTVLDGEPAEADRFWGAGVVAADLDGDRDVDLFVPGPHAARLLRNTGGGAFVDDPAALPELDWTRTVGAAAADVDGDRDLDLVVTRWGGEDWLLLGEDGAFVHADAAFSIPSHSQSASFADADGDGDLDLAIGGHGPVEGGEQVVVTGPSDGTRLWLGDGTGGFTDAIDRLSADVRDGYTYVVGWTDLDADGRADWLLANDYPLFIPTLAAYNRGDRVVTAEDRGLGWVVAGMGLGTADVNEDGVDDFLLPAWNRIVAPLSTPGPWIDAADALGLVVPDHPGDAWVGWGGDWVDVDLDGDLDALVSWGHLDTVGETGPSGGPTANAPDQRFTVYLQDDRQFVESAGALGLDDVGAWRGFSVADLNDDGWPDLIRRDLHGAVVIDVSRCGESAWIRVVPEPPANAVGAEVRVWVGDRVLRQIVHAGGTSLASGGPPEVRFGLGSAEFVDRVEIRWPDGAEDAVGPMPVRTTVHLAR
jgi:hypothetical protein